MVVVENLALSQHAAVRHIAPLARLVLALIDEERFTFIAFTLLHTTEINRDQNILDLKRKLANFSELTRNTYEFKFNFGRAWLQATMLVRLSGQLSKAFHSARIKVLAKRDTQQDFAQHR